MLDHEDAKALVRQGQEAGFLTHEEIALALGDDFEPVQLDEFYSALGAPHRGRRRGRRGRRARPPATGAKISTDALQLFLKDIGSSPSWRGTGGRAGQAHRAGRPPSKQTMVESNLRLVVSIAKNYRNQGLPFLDLIQEGRVKSFFCIGSSITARALKFSTYATWWIRQAVARRSRTRRGRFGCPCTSSRS